MAGFFPVFYNSLTGDLNAKDAQFWFNITLALSSILVAISAPLLGAIADHGGKRKKFLLTFACLGIVMTAGLAWVHAGMWSVGLILYGLGTVGFAGANIFYDSLLVEVAEDDELDLVSSFGYAMGYIGGGLLFSVNVLMVTKPGWFGLADANAAVAFSFLSVSVWWAVFTIPLLRGVKEPVALHGAKAGRAIQEGVAHLLDTLREIKKLKILLLFLIGYWLYIDAVNTVIKVAVFFGGKVLNLPQQDLVLALLLTQFIAFPAALAFGKLGSKIGPRPAILIGLVVYLASIIYAWRWLDTSVDFYKLAIAIGLVQGGVQSLSRSLFARMVPRSKAAEFFGFFNMVGKFAAFLGPLFMAGVPLLIAGTGERDAILSLSILFIAGGFLLWKVDVKKGMAEAAAMDKANKK